MAPFAILIQSLTNWLSYAWSSWSSSWNKQAYMVFIF